MKLRWTMAALLLPGLLWMPVARAAPPPSAQIEVSFLLGYIEGSGCEFYRNGTWYSARAAQMHVRDKYNVLVARDQIDTADEFIDKAATQSSLSGQAYMVRCNGGPPLTTQRWLRDELARFRTF